MLQPLIDSVDDNTALSAPWGRGTAIAFLFLGAWVLARASAIVARKLLAWHDRRHAALADDLTDKRAALKRRETLVGVIRASIAGAGFAAAGVLSVAQLLGGVDRLTALAGASFVFILAGFAIQRLLVDMLAGLAMFVERWFSVGDTIFVPGLEVQGVVEDVSLRRTRLRTVDGEVIHVNNSQIPAVRVLPRGAKELAVELFVNDRERAEQLISAVTAILPEGPTTFVKRPQIEEVDDLADTLVRIRLSTSVAAGREWLAEGFFPDLLRERAGDDLIAHGPVVLGVDESATRSFARASAALRPQAPQPLPG
jgi:moderate conductance mechanosensitive channel